MRRRVSVAAAREHRAATRVNGEPLPAKATRDLTAGDVVAIETPGGGGPGGKVSEMSGRVEGIFLSPEHGELPEPVDRVNAHAGEAWRATVTTGPTALRRPGVRSR